MSQILHKISSFISGLMGGAPKMFYALILLILLDYITGLCVAIQEKKISSRIGLRGITQKLMIIIIITVGSVVDKLFLDGQYALSTVTILFYSTNEAISILENACRMGLPIPTRLKDVLLEAKGTNSTDSEQ